MNQPMKAIVRCAALAAICVMVSACQTGKKKSTFTLDEQPPPPAVGQWFEYDHKGPKPWANNDQTDVSGKRRVRVIKQHKGKTRPLWEIEETFAADPNEQYAWVDQDYQLFGQLLTSPEAEMAIRYEKPMPLRHLKLKAAGEETFSTDQTALDPDTQQEYGVTKITRKTKRLRDERVVSPAGALMCRHFQTEIVLERDVMIKWNNKIETSTITFRAVEETYWCDALQWFVYEKIEFQPVLNGDQMLADGYVTECLLVDYEQAP